MTNTVDKIKGHPIKDCAEQAVSLLSSYYDITLTPQEQYFLGKEIMERSGAYYELPSKMNTCED